MNFNYKIDQKLCLQNSKFSFNKYSFEVWLALIDILNGYINYD